MRSHSFAHAQSMLVARQTSTGCFLEGHIPASCFDEAHALCKPRGHFVTSLRSEYWVNGQKDGYKDKIDKMVT